MSTVVEITNFWASEIQSYQHRSKTFEHVGVSNLARGLEGYASLPVGKEKESEATEALEIPGSSTLT